MKRMEVTKEITIPLSSKASSSVIHMHANPQNFDKLRYKKNFFTCSCGYRGVFYDFFDIHRFYCPKCHNKDFFIFKTLKTNYKLLNDVGLVGYMYKNDDTRESITGELYNPQISQEVLDILSENDLKTNFVFTVNVQEKTFNLQYTEYQYIYDAGKNRTYMHFRRKECTDDIFKFKLHGILNRRYPSTAVQLILKELCRVSEELYGVDYIINNDSERKFYNGYNTEELSLAKEPSAMFLPSFRTLMEEHLMSLYFNRDRESQINLNTQERKLGKILNMPKSIYNLLNLISVGQYNDTQVIVKSDENDSSFIRLIDLAIKEIPYLQKMSEGGTFVNYRVRTCPEINLLTLTHFKDKILKREMREINNNTSIYKFLVSAKNSNNISWHKMLNIIKSYLLIYETLSEKIKNEMLSDSGYIDHLIEETSSNNLLSYGLNRGLYCQDVLNMYINLVCKYKCNENSLVKYILANTQKVIDVHEIITLLYDYSKMVKMLDISRDKYPKELKKEHDIVLERYNKETALEDNPIWDKALKSVRDDFKKLECSDDNFVLKIPTTVKEVIDEGKQLHHCVASYVDRIVNGYSLILFVRYKGQEDTPLYTAELNPSTMDLVQFRGTCNRDPESRASKFLTTAIKNAIINTTIQS